MAIRHNKNQIEFDQADMDTFPHAAMVVFNDVANDGQFKIGGCRVLTPPEFLEYVQSYHRIHVLTDLERERIQKLEEENRGEENE